VSNLDVALKCARAGLHVFPVTPDKSKRPTVRGNWRENSTADATTIRKWWSIRTSHLVAIDLGKSNLLILDGDRHPNEDGEIINDGVEALRNLFRTHGGDARHCPGVWTPTGGIHLYLRACGFGNASGDLPEGVDVRGAGGYAVAPGCLLPDGRGYRLVPGMPDLLDAFEEERVPSMPLWLAKILKPEREVIAVTITPSCAGRREHAYARRALQGIVIELASMKPETGRNQTLNAVAYRLGRFAARGWLNRSEVEAELFNACIANRLVADEGARAAQKTIRSGLLAGLQQPAGDLKDRK
jgi:hypothetical protein